MIFAYGCTHLCLFVICFMGVVCVDEIGDVCFHKVENIEGKCTLLTNCSTLGDSKNQNNHQFCGLAGNNQIVCCPNNEIAKTDSKSNNSPNITTTVGLKSIEKCKEYAKTVFITRPSFGGDSTVDTCKIKVTPLIVGNKVTSKDFPHVVEIGYDSRSGHRIYNCVGSLISEAFVITSGHCLSTRCYGRAKYVRLGGLDSSPELGQIQLIHIAEIIQHPDYKPQSLYHDIGLVKMAQNAKFTIYVRPICLNTHSTFPPGEYNRFIDLYEARNHDYSKQFYYLVPQANCSKVYGETQRLANGIDNESQICAGAKADSQELCGVDFGGPLQIYHNDVYCMYKLIGVSSFGNSCLFQQPQEEIIRVYSRVSNYIEWIEKNVWP